MSIRGAPLQTAEDVDEQGEWDDPPLPNEDDDGSDGDGNSDDGKPKGEVLGVLLFFSGMPVTGIVAGAIIWGGYSIMWGLLPVAMVFLGITIVGIATEGQ